LKNVKGLPSGVRTEWASQLTLLGSDFGFFVLRNLKNKNNESFDSFTELSTQNNFLNSVSEYVMKANCFIKKELGLTFWKLRT